MRSRRAFNGWFPGIGGERRAVHKVDKVLGQARRGKWDEAIHQATSATGTPPQLRAIPAPGSETLTRAAWIRKVSALRREMRHKLQGSVRHAKRRRISDWVAKREAAWGKGGIRQLVDSVMGGGKSAGLLRTVEDADGAEHSTGAGVKRAVTEYFDGAFGGGKATEAAAGQPAALAALAEDSEEGRRLREGAANGVLPPEWRRVMGQRG